MKTLKHTTLLALGLAASLGLNAVQAQQSEHDGHHAENDPSEQASTQPKTQQGGMMQGMDHDKMKDMHEQHMGNGHMDHGGMGGGSVDKDMPKDAEQGNPHAH
ncbi:hypothetical protein LQF05_07140 [Stutzerimonas stutzeri]|uniref:hypothetical protein n=1 Tax=Stutzerimonas stutzeri TaxID=316 RepID=UPI00066A5ECE|nr:hypothetical protein [Stutzerimonas stutzeri]WBL61678.1 hypothetical protein LQF05_07140 [Stutzerimonas stutzeri]